MAALLFVAIAPAMFLLAFVYLSDIYEREPLSTVGSVYLKGMLLLPPAAIMEVLLSRVVSPDITIESFLVVGLTEEFCKFVGAMVIFYRSFDFNEEMDGVVYSTALSLGFATAENVLYVVTRGTQIGLLRAVLPVPGHAMFAIAMGYYLGKAKFSTGKKRVDEQVKALFVPVVLHGAYNYFLTANVWLLLLIIPLMAYLWWSGLSAMRDAESDSPFKKRPFFRRGA